MRNYLKQDGYTLLLTLVIAVLLFLITATFTVASMNQTKQIETTDDNFVATSLAEMGFEKNHKIIMSEFELAYSQYEDCISSNDDNCTAIFTNNFTPSISLSMVTVDQMNSSSYDILSFERDSQANDYYVLIIKGTSNNVSKYITAKYFIPTSLEFGDQIDNVIVEDLFSEDIPYVSDNSLDTINDGDRLNFNPNTIVEGFRHVKDIKNVWIKSNNTIAHKFFALKSSKIDIENLEFKFPSGSQNKIDGTVAKIGKLVFNEIPNSAPHKFKLTNESSLCVNQLVLKTSRVENNKGDKTTIVTETAIESPSAFRDFINLNTNSYAYVKLGQKYYMFFNSENPVEIDYSVFTDKCKFSLPDTIDPLEDISYTNNQPI